MTPEHITLPRAVVEAQEAVYHVCLDKWGAENGVTKDAKDVLVYLRAALQAQAAAPSQYGSPELQSLILAKLTEKAALDRRRGRELDVLGFCEDYPTRHNARATVQSGANVAVERDVMPELKG